MCNREFGSRLVQTTEGDYEEHSDSEDNRPWCVGARCLMLGKRQICRTGKA